MRDVFWAFAFVLFASTNTHTYDPMRFHRSGHDTAPPENPLDISQPPWELGQLISTLMKLRNKDGQYDDSNRIDMSLLKSPKNVRRYLFPLIRQSNIRNKAEVFRVMTSFLNPRNRTPHGFLGNVLRLGDDTIEELMKIMTDYQKTAIAAIYGDKYNAALKLLENKNSSGMIRAINSFLRSIDPKYLEMYFDTLKKEADAPPGKNDILFNLSEDDKNMLERAKEMLHHFQILDIISILDDPAELIGRSKNATINFIEAAIDGFESKIAEEDVRSTLSFRKDSSFRSGEFYKSVQPFLSPDMIGQYFESNLRMFQQFDHKNAKKAYMEFNAMLPNVVRLVTHFAQVPNAEDINNAADIFLSGGIPEPFDDVFVDGLRMYAKAVNIDFLKTMRNLTKRFSENEMRLDYEPLSVIKSVFSNLYNDALPKISFSSNNIEELKRSMLALVEKIDPVQYGEFLKDQSKNLQTANTSQVADVLIDIRKLVRHFIVIDQNLSKGKVKDMRSLTNSTILHDGVVLVLDILKLIDEPPFEKGCVQLLNLVDDNWNELLTNAIVRVKLEFGKIQNGVKTLQKLKIVEILTFVAAIVRRLHPKGTCRALGAILISSKDFDDNTIDEIVTILSVMQRIIADGLKNSSSNENHSQLNTILDFLGDIEAVISEKYPRSNNTLGELVEVLIEKFEPYFYGVKK